MEEIQKIKGLFEDLFDGNPWLEVTLMGTLKAITAEQAAAKPDPERNSIWEIANHLIAWRQNVLHRVKGTVIETPAHNYFLPVHDSSPAHWQQTLENLGQTQKNWTSFLSQLKTPELNEVYPPNGHSHYEHIHGILQHDAYHLGQIVMLAKHP